MAFEMAEVRLLRENASHETLAALSAGIDHALSSEDLPLLGEQTHLWQELMDSEEAFYEELALMNPLAKAVLANCPVAVGFLIKTCGLRLEAFHPSGCGCSLCRRMVVDRRFLQRHLEVIVQAASRPLYAMCADPDGAIEHCLQLCKDLKRYRGHVTAASWQPIDDGIEETILAVLEVAGTEKEAIQLLEMPGEAEQRLERVLELVDSGLLPVCAHPTLQAVVDRAWYGEALPVDLRTMPLPVCLFGALFCYLVLTPTAVFWPHPKLLRVLSTPVVRFSSDSVSFLLTLILCVVVASLTRADISMMCDVRQGQSEILWIESWQLLLMVMLTALLLRFASALWFCGLRVFVSGYNVLHFLGVLFHFFGSLLILLFFVVLPRRSSLREACDWFRALPNSTHVDTTCAASEAAYKRHPIVMDAIMTFGEPYIVGTTIFGFGHLLYFASAGHVLSMWRLMAEFIIAAERMILDVAKWFIFCIIFFLAWAVAMETVYSSYRCNNVYFSSFPRAIRQLFWASLTMGERNDYKLVGEVAKSPSWLEVMVERVGWLMYMLFFLVTAIIMMNLLIALMAVTFQNIQDDKEIFRIHRKTRVKLKFVLWEDDLPAPFNLFFPVFLVSKLAWKKASRFFCEAPEIESSNDPDEQNLRSVQNKMRSLCERYQGSRDNEDIDKLISGSP